MKARNKNLSERPLKSLIDQITFKPLVVGSSPTRLTNLFRYLRRVGLVHSDTAASAHSDKSAGFVLVARRFFATVAT
jgi:hypothetical protein